jgi:hypothetical protein
MEIPGQISAEIDIPSMAGRMVEQRWRLTSIVLETAGGRRAAARIITRIFGPANMAEKLCDGYFLYIYQYLVPHGAFFSSQSCV